MQTAVNMAMFPSSQSSCHITGMGGGGGNCQNFGPKLYVPFSRTFWVLIVTQPKYELCSQSFTSFLVQERNAVLRALAP